MKLGKDSFTFNNVYLNETATVVGPKEGVGPINQYFDKIYKDLAINELSFEKAEIKMQIDAMNILLRKSLELESNIDMVLAGDLINQEVVSNYSLRSFNIPFCGIYGACSTAALSIIMGSIIIDGNNASKIIAMTSSHNSTSERQFRNPNEYGGAKSETQTSTVTGACAALITNKKSKIKISGATLGKIIDVDFTDQADMGRAMAPAAIETITTHFNDFNTTPSDYDLIVTGDLSFFGSEIVYKHFNEVYPALKNYNDCGLIIYNRKVQDVFAGGSGCACCGVVSYSYIKEELLKGNLNKVLICGTGALMNTDMILQKESIPSICHAMIWEAIE